MMNYSVEYKAWDTTYRVLTSGDSLIAAAKRAINNADLSYQPMPDEITVRRLGVVIGEGHANTQRYRITQNAPVVTYEVRAI